MKEQQRLGTRKIRKAIEKEEIGGGARRDGMEHFKWEYKRE